jgi:hypothetical protein
MFPPTPGRWLPAWIVFAALPQTVIEAVSSTYLEHIGFGKVQVMGRYAWQLLPGGELPAGSPVVGELNELQAWPYPPLTASSYLSEISPIILISCSKS